MSTSITRKKTTHFLTDAEPESAVATVAPDQSAALSLDILGEAVKGAGKGLSQAPEDNLVPLAFVLQALSPQCDRRDPQHIPGAEPGAIWLRNAPTPIIPGETGVLFQHCYFTKVVIEWVPRTQGGGMIAIHQFQPGESVEEFARRMGAITGEDKDRFKMYTEDGHELIETRQHAGFFILDGQAIPYVIPFSSTGHTVSRNWMTQMNNRKPANWPPDKKPLGWLSYWRLRTVQRTKAAGTWFAWDPTWERFVGTLEDFRRGEELYEAFAKGTKQAAAVDVGEMDREAPF